MAESEIPTVAICMGDIGTASRILAGKFVAPFTYATFHQERVVSLRGNSVSSRWATFIITTRSIPIRTYTGLIADPVVHSPGPLLHNEAFRHLKVDKVCVPFRVPREQLESFIGYCRQFGIRGLSVNMPHKEAVLPFVSETDRAVDHIGAANTVVIDGFDRSAFNTEYRAALESIDSTLGRGGEIDVLNGKTARSWPRAAWPKPWPTRCVCATSMSSSLRVRWNVHANWPIN